MKLRTRLLRFCLLALLTAGCVTGPAPTQEAPPATPPTLPGTASPSPTPLSGPYVTPPVEEQVIPPSASPLPTATTTPTSAPTPVPPVRFAVIGDYGLAGQPEADVAALIKSWNPDFILTTGDNNYPSGSAETIEENIGQYYAEYIAPDNSAAGTRFFPTLGNHDWDTPGAQPYLDYFSLPGNERYYDFTWGPVHLFALNGDPREPDGVGSSSVQAAWLQARLASSTALWRIVYFHQSPYSSGLQGSVEWMRWPFREWGATAVLSGHDHTYERLLIDGLPYFVNGLGGGPIYDFETIQDGSQVRYNADHGALFVEASQGALTFQFINRQGEIIDSFSVNAGGDAPPSPDAAAVSPAAALDHTLAVLPAARVDLAELSNLPQYTLQLSLDYAGLTFTGHGQVDYTNNETVSLEQVCFRLFPNGGRSYGDGSLSVSTLRVDSQPARSELSLGDTVLTVELPRALAPAERISLEFDFAGVVPQDFGDGLGYGIYNYSEGVLALANWYPVLAAYDEQGWNLDPVTRIGDAVYSDTALYTVEVTAPDELALATTGVQTDRQSQGGRSRYRFVSGPARDFFLVASPAFQRISQVVDGTQINSYYLPEHEAGGQVALSVAAGSLKAFNDLFGAYPYVELDVVDAPMNGAGGVEYPGIVLVASDNYTEPDGDDLDFTTAHEVAHQWWYGLVGNDVIDDPWLDEALATYSSGLYYEQAHGEAFFQGFVNFLESGYEQLLQRGEDERVTRGVDEFESSAYSGNYGEVVYIKGALALHQIRQAIGDAAFFAALQHYFQAEKYGIARPADLLNAFETASGQSLDGLYDEWLYSP